MMKCVFLCVVLFCAVAVYGYPQRVTLVGIPRSPYFDPEGYEPRQHHTRQDSAASEGSDETALDFIPSAGFDSSDPNDPYMPRDFSDIMNRMQEAMINLRREMDAILHRLPQTPDEKGVEGSDKEGFGGFGGLGGVNQGFGSFDDIFPIGSDFDLSNAKNESTSDTKEIDGQLVTFNNTVYKGGDANHRTIFRVKTIVVKPKKEPGSDVEPDTESTTASEISEEVPERTISKNEDSNDIPNNEGKMHFSEWGSTETENIPSDDQNEVEATNDIEVIEPNYAKQPAQYYDLSKDTLVNDYVSDQKVSQGLVMLNPDAEFIDVDKSNSKENEYYRYESQPVQADEDKLKNL